MQIRRVVTGHKPNGDATVIIDEVSTDIVHARQGAKFCEVWSSPFPVDNDDATDGAKQIVGTAMKGRSVFRLVEYQPGVIPRNHRTDSIDYGIVLSGAIHMELDAGEVVVLNAGDVLVQRGTIHNWSNRGTVPCVIAFVLIDAPAAKIAGNDMHATG